MSESAPGSSKLDALRSTSIIGGASAITMGIRMVRTKVLAILLGPAGVGLEGIYDSVLVLIRMVFELGLSGSGVRQIASSLGTGDSRRIARTAQVLRRTTVVLGVAGAIALFLGREWASRAAFGDSDHAWAFGWLALAVFFGVVSLGLGALIQGMLRTGDLARMNIIGAAIGAVVSIPVVFIWGQSGIPAYMTIAAATGALTAWYYARRIQLVQVQVAPIEIAREMRGLLALGTVFMLTTLLSNGGAFLVRAMVTREFGLVGAGQFHASNALSMAYVGFLVQAMWTDFYPRLAAASRDDAQCNRVVNEQAEISLLLALPGVFVTMALSPWVMHIFYTGEFREAAGILVWQMGGMLLRVMALPVAIVTMAKNRSRIFFWVEFFTWSFYVVVAWLAMQWFGLSGVGIAFFGVQVAYVLVIYAIVRHLTGFRWKPHYARLAAISFVAAGLMLWMRLTWPEPWASIASCCIAAVGCLWALRGLIRIVGIERSGDTLRRFGMGWSCRILERISGRG